MIQNEQGFPREPEVSNRATNVAQTSTVVANQQSNATRTFISIINTSAAANIYLSVGEEAVDGKGFLLAPGGYFAEDTSSIVYPSQKQYNCIADAANGTVAIQERTITGEF